MKRTVPPSIRLFFLLLLLCLILGVARAEASALRTMSATSWAASSPEMRALYARLPRGSGRIRSVRSPSSLSVRRYNLVAVTATIKPATQQALDDLAWSWECSKIEHQSFKSSLTDAGLTVTITYLAKGKPGSALVHFYSRSRRSVGDSTRVKIQPVPVQSVLLSASEATLGAGKSLKLSALVLPDAASSKGVKFKTSNARVATVTSGGTVKGRKPGSAKITVTTKSGGKKAACIVTVVAAAPSPSPAPSDPTVYRALLIGNSAYIDEDGELHSLNGPYNDLKAMNAALERSTICGRKYTGNITQLRDLKKSQILSAVATLASKGIDANDVTLIYFSGHGRYGDTEACASIVGVDYEGLTVPELKAALDVIPGDVIVILDSCFSGAFIGKAGSAPGDAGKRFNARVIGAFSAPKAKSLAGGRYHVITSSTKDETSISFGIGYNGGNFTYIGLSTYYLAISGGYDLFHPSGNILFGDYSPANGVASIGEVASYTDYWVDNFVKGSSCIDSDQDVQYYSADPGFPLFGRR